MMMDDALFRRVKAVFDNRATLAPDQQRRGGILQGAFVRTAPCSTEAPERPSSRSSTPSFASLYLTFNETNYERHQRLLHRCRRPGAPRRPSAEQHIAGRRRSPSTRPRDKWVFTLHAPSRLPLLLPTTATCAVRCTKATRRWPSTASGATSP